MLDRDRRIGHVEVEIGDAGIMLFDAQSEWPPTPAHLRVYVADTQDAFDRAVAAGGRGVTHPTELPSGSMWHHPGLEPLVGHLTAIGEHGIPSPQSRLHFIGMRMPLSGFMHEVGIDARQIAGKVARELGG